MKRRDDEDDLGPQTLFLFLLMAGATVMLVVYGIRLWMAL